MAIQTELDKPADITDWKCKWCGQSMTVTHHWVLSLWLHPTVHDTCADAYMAKQTERAGPKPLIPERFRDWQVERFQHKQAFADAVSFDPDSAFKTLVIVGEPGNGKTRLMWTVINQFFDVMRQRTGEQRWVDHYLFTDIVSELDKTLLAKMKMTKYLYVSDVGSVDSYGRERAGLQQVLRSRIQHGQWTFLCIDSLQTFDPGLEDFFKGRATVISIG
jgi:hypothetical protein